MCFDNITPTQPPPATIRLRHHQCVQTSRQSGWPVTPPKASDLFPHHKLQTTPSIPLPHPISSRTSPSPAKPKKKKFVEMVSCRKESLVMTTTCQFSFAGTHSRINPHSTQCCFQTMFPDRVASQPHTKTSKRHLAAARLTR
ncbi:hypothetical protein CKAH01_09691 [Colletotrichum kahawae]|uniref:Uncharacterized protein n=1 Tax=Colletotrichum kahawae TaxID=34407 RepID=A0AAE0CYM9_COLKA|nr:hypothetical protein CKAH01_09691 [Colletotrichum kahawae]